MVLRDGQERIESVSPWSNKSQSRQAHTKSQAQGAQNIVNYNEKRRNKSNPFPKNTSFQLVSKLTTALRGSMNATFGRQSQGIGCVNPNGRENRLKATQALEVCTSDDRTAAFGRWLQRLPVWWSNRWLAHLELLRVDPTQGSSNGTNQKQAKK